LHLENYFSMTGEYIQYQTLNYLPYGEEWIELQNSLDPNLGYYTFNGKEKDYESGFHYYGARYYWSELLTGWLSVDPLADKYPSISPYAYCTWNPVKLIDPDGKDIYLFLKDGRYFNKIHAPGEHVGMAFCGNKPIKFSFADPINDPVSIEKGILSKIQFVKESDIVKMMSSAGAFNNNNRNNSLKYARKEGVGYGKLDFSGKPEDGMGSIYGQDTYRSIYLIDGVAHNPQNFGNFLFGAAGESLEIPLPILKLGAHWNSLTGKNNGYKPQLDSKDDQFSIECGYKHAAQHNYEAINESLK
jgi:RHS repeat-associated protein